MTTTIVKHSYYKIEIDTVDAPQQPIVYFRKEGKCKTAKGMERQHNRIVNETVEEWRQFSSRSVATPSLVSLLASMWQHDRSILLTWITMALGLWSIASQVVTPDKVRSPTTCWTSVARGYTPTCSNDSWWVTVRKVSQCVLSDPSHGLY